MNKYQKALDNLIRVSCPKHTSCKECDFANVCNCEAKDYVNTLQELIDITTPNKSTQKNAEKYAEQIAELIASRVDGVCAIFSNLEMLRCVICPLHGICNNKDKLKDWLLQESNAKNKEENIKCNF